MKGRVRIPGMIRVVVGLLLLALLMSPPSAPVSAASCKDGYFAVGGYDGSGYGVGGRLHVTDPNTVCMWSNQVGVSFNVNNWVEGGWQESPYNFGNSGKHPFTFKKRAGVGYVKLFPDIWLSVGSNPRFRLVSRVIPGEYEWDFYKGTQWLWSWAMSYGVGQVQAQQERWNHADGEQGGQPAGESHIWSLERADYSRNWIGWSYLEGKDMDVDYRYFEYFWDNSQFWVYPD